MGPLYQVSYQAPWVMIFLSHDYKVASNWMWINTVFKVKKKRGLPFVALLCKLQNNIKQINQFQRGKAVSAKMQQAQKVPVFGSNSSYKSNLTDIYRNIHILNTAKPDARSAIRI